MPDAEINIGGDISAHAARTTSNVRQSQTRPLTGRRLENHVCFADPVMQKIFIFR